MTKSEFFECPSGAMDCPYFDSNGHCTMYPEYDPREECDEAGYYADDDYFDDYNSDMGFDPYMGCYTYDC